MSPDESVDRLGQLLFDAGFDPERPQFACFWSVFKHWVREPVECCSDRVSISLESDESNRCDFVELLRVFDHEQDELAFQFMSRFLSDNADRPRLPHFHAGSDSLPSRSESLLAIEKLPEFHAALAYEHWEFEAYRE